MNNAATQKPVQFAARFPGQCGLGCGSPIVVGQMIQKSGGRYVHVVCREVAVGGLTFAQRDRALDGRDRMQGVSWESVVDGNEGWDGETEIALSALKRWMAVNPQSVTSYHTNLSARFQREIAAMYAAMGRRS
jgi:hypothetical protein